MGNDIKVQKIGNFDSILLYKDKNSNRVNSILTNMLGKEYISTRDNLHRNVTFYNSNNSVKVRVHIFIWQPNGKCYHATSIKNNLEIEKEHYLSKKDGNTLFKRAYEKAIFYCSKTKLETEIPYYLMALPIT